MAEQKYVGRKLSDGTSIWHTNSKGRYWSGWMPESITADELYYACLTTLHDLATLHPELSAKYKEILPICEFHNCNNEARFEGWYKVCDLSGNLTGSTINMRVCKECVKYLIGGTPTKED